MTEQAKQSRKSPARGLPLDPRVLERMVDRVSNFGFDEAVKQLNLSIEIGCKTNWRGVDARSQLRNALGKPGHRFLPYWHQYYI